MALASKRYVDRMTARGPEHPRRLAPPGIEKIYHRFQLTLASATSVDIAAGSWIRNGVIISEASASGIADETHPYIVAAINTSLVPTTLTISAEATWPPDSADEWDTKRLLCTLEYTGETGSKVITRITRCQIGDIDDRVSRPDASMPTPTTYSIEEDVTTKERRLYDFDSAAVYQVPRKNDDYVPRLEWKHIILLSDGSHSPGNIELVSAPTWNSTTGAFVLPVRDVAINEGRAVFAKDLHNETCTITGIKGDKGDTGAKGDKGDPGDNTSHHILLGRNDGGDDADHLWAWCNAYSADYVSDNTRNYGFSIGNPSGMKVIDLESHELLVNGSFPSVDWVNMYLYKASGEYTLGWNDEVLYSAAGIASINWALRRLYDSTGAIIVVDWNAGKLWDTQTTSECMLDWLTTADLVEIGKPGAGLGKNLTVWGDIAIPTGKALKVNGKQVVSDQQADPEDVAETGTNEDGICRAKVNEILHILRMHGLIA